MILIRKLLQVEKRVNTSVKCKNKDKKGVNIRYSLVLFIVIVQDIERLK